MSPCRFSAAILRATDEAMAIQERLADQYPDLVVSDNFTVLKKFADDTLSFVHGLDFNVRAWRARKSKSS